MSSNVVAFRNPAKPIAQFIRIDDAHRRLGDLYAAGRLHIRRAVFDASRIAAQRDFVMALKRDGVEIVLDTEIAELAAICKIETHVKRAPWATVGEGNPLHSAFFDGSYSQINIIKMIAEFAIEHGVNTILAPSHFLGDRNFENWSSIDRNSCNELRKILDISGGKDISIDFPVIHSHVALNDSNVRKKILEPLRDVPFDNLWIRASGLGNEPKPQSIKQFLVTLSDIQKIGKPIILDYSEGLTAHAILAFGGVSGVSHGIGERLHFDASSWHKPAESRDKDKPFGRTSYVVVPGLGKRLSVNEFNVLVSAKGGRKHLGCQDACCAHGVRDMIGDPRQHAAFQAVEPIRKLSLVPDLNRVDFFIEKPLREAEQIARNLKDLNPAKAEIERLNVDMPSLKRRLSEHHRRIGKLSDTLQVLQDTRGSTYPRALSCNYREEQNNQTENRELK